MEQSLSSAAHERAGSSRPALSPPLRDRVFRIVCTLADRLSHPHNVLASLSTLWSPTSLCTGWPGLALFFSALAQATGENHWSDVAFEYLAMSAEATRLSPLQDPSLSKGISGLAMAISCFSAVDSRLEATRASLDGVLDRHCCRSPWQMKIGGRMVLNYDTIVGVSGTLGYMVSRPALEVHKEPVSYLLSLLMDFLAPHGHLMPARWAIPASFFPAQKERYRDRLVINCGMAHGMPGPLAALSLASLAGFCAPGQREVIRSLADWLVGQQLQTPWGGDWPAVIPIDLLPDQRQLLPPARSAWCYGAPGVARSLWLAGQALQDASLQKLACQAMQSALRRPVEARQLDPLTLCHGVSGLLLVCLIFFHETGDVFLQEGIVALTEELLREYREEAPFGFEDCSDGKPGASLGLLLGVTGTLLVLLAASTAHPPSWSRALLIA